MRPPGRLSRRFALSSIKPTLTLVSLRRRRSSGAHHARIGMRKKTGLLEHHLAHGRKVFERALEAQLFQKFLRFRKNSLRLIAQAQQSLFASARRPASATASTSSGVM